MKNIIMQNGQIIPLATWQDLMNLPSEFITNNYRLDYYVMQNGVKVYPFANFEVSCYVLELLNALYDKDYKVINSLYRSDAKQKELLKTNSNAAKISPHVFGMAADVDSKDSKDTITLSQLVKKLAAELGIKVRLGYTQYIAKGNSFVHFDVCPEYYAEGKPYHNINHPKPWETQIEW